jgi:hypothetical protein
MEKSANTVIAIMFVSIMLLYAPLMVNVQHLIRAVVTLDGLALTAPFLFAMVLWPLILLFAHIAMEHVLQMINVLVRVVTLDYNVKFQFAMAQLPIAALSALLMDLV